MFKLTTVEPTSSSTSGWSGGAKKEVNWLLKEPLQGSLTQSGLWRGFVTLVHWLCYIGVEDWGVPVRWVVAMGRALSCVQCEGSGIMVRDVCSLVTSMSFSFKSLLDFAFKQPYVSETMCVRHSMYLKVLCLLVRVELWGNGLISQVLNGYTESPMRNGKTSVRRIWMLLISGAYAKGIVGGSPAGGPGGHCEPPGWGLEQRPKYFAKIGFFKSKYWLIISFQSQD